MSSTILLSPQREVAWSSSEEPLFVGKDILELLSSSMYVDPMSMYREYVQNSADAIEMARNDGSLKEVGTVEIKLEHASRTILIRDNGIGLGKDDFLRQLTALGGSRKRGTNARGFRGVGRLAGLAFCQELLFRSRQQGESCVHELKWDSKAVRSLLRAADDSCDLREVVARSIRTRDISGRGWPGRFFEVELRGVTRHKDDRLLSEDHVINYLAQVAPVPFSPEFKFGNEIQSFLSENGVPAGSIHIQILGRGQVYRPHRNEVQVGKAKTDLQNFTTILTPGRDGELAAVTWIIHHDYMGSLPSHSLIDGWRVRCGDIQIGDNNLLQALFPESRFNSWCVAETHVLDPRILPNGRRDHFEQNNFYFDLLNHLAPHARTIAQRCRQSSINRNLLKSLEAGLSESSNTVRILEKGLMTESASRKLSCQVLDGLERLQKTAGKSAIIEERRLAYVNEIEKLRSRVVKLGTASKTDGVLNKVPPSQRAILKEVFDTIYRSYPDLPAAQKLVDKIMHRIRAIRTI